MQKVYIYCHVRAVPKSFHLNGHIAPTQNELIVHFLFLESVIGDLFDVLGIIVWMTDFLSSLSF